ncbi:MAG: translation elongation factor Ts [Anaerolineaceae bacterium]|nr:MAG: translation elongation factor Ts [Anaerolineaceae bacterium]
MAEITAKMVKELREATGAGPLDCKRALQDNDGDVQKAIDWLRERGLSKAAKKLGAGRTMNEGRVEVYSHFNNRLAVLVEVNCETDFVAQTEAFRTFCTDIAMHIASMAPQYLNREDVPQADIEHEQALQLRILKEDPKNANKPDDILKKIIEGRMNKFFEDMVLMEQAFFKDDAKTIADLLQETVAAIGESVQVRRFARFALGEGADDEGDDA